MTASCSDLRLGLVCETVDCQVLTMHEVAFKFPHYHMISQLCMHACVVHALGVGPG